MATLDITHPDLAKQWHPTKNGELKPSSISAGTHKKAWWLCERTCNEGCIHEWEGSVANRTRKGTGCPWCSNKQLCEHKSIIHTHPELVKQWHPTKNGNLQLSNLSAGSHKKVWWLCPNSCSLGCIHEWDATISNRCGRGDGCPYCSSSQKEFCIHNTIQYTHPELAKQWHPTKNGDMKPSDVSAGSGKKIWWLCPMKCSHGCSHEWENSVSNRCSGDKITNCPWCINQRHCEHMSIKYTHPELAKQWHPTKNGTLDIKIIMAGSEKKIWWLCPLTCSYGCLHEWETTPYIRTKISPGCAVCSKKGPNGKICEHDSILYTHPNIAKEWHPTKNVNLDIKKISSGSNKKAWWLCPNSCSHGCLHEWESAVPNRTGRGDGCPYCSSSQKALCIHNSIVYTHPELAKQWHPTKNGDMKPENYSYGSDVKVWWLCEKKCDYGCLHEWQSNINNRSKGDICPFCNPFQKQCCIHTSIVYTHPEIVKQWHPTKNGSLKPENYTKGAMQEVWWLCENKCTYGCLHEWKTSINTRTSGHGCGFCRKLKKCEHDSIKYTHPALCLEWDYELNKEHDILLVGKSSHIKAYWICSKNPLHKWQTKVINRVAAGTGCIWCINKTESMLYNYLKVFYPCTEKQLKLDGCKNKYYLPFDFYIPQLKVIIELDGLQHFKQVSNWKSPEDAIKRDIFKMQQANKEGYKVIRIFQEDVYNNDNNWLDTNLLSEINDTSRNNVFISSIDTLYDEHIKMMELGNEIILSESDSDNNSI